MNVAAKMIIVLTLIAMLSGGVLSYWDAFTQPKIEYHRLEALKAAVADVLPAYDEYVEVAAGEFTFYVGKSDTAISGVAFRTEGSGFQGNISLMMGVKPDFSEITGLKILEQIETPGLGTKIVVDPSKKENPLWFTDQFKGISIASDINVVKNIEPSDNTEIQAITGATISSKAVVRIINQAKDKAKEIYESR
jgi:electron transport complex protein RnfG